MTICFWLSLRHPQRIVPDGEVADGQLLPRLHQRLLFLLETLTGKAEEDQHDADVHDVAAVAALGSADKADERRDDVGARRRAPDAGAADELLRDRRQHEGTQREAQTGAPETNAKRVERPPAVTTNASTGHFNW